MLVIAAVVVVWIAAAVIRRLQFPSRASVDDLGYMSEQWLAEYRASHSA